MYEDCPIQTTGEKLIPVPVKRYGSDWTFLASETLLKEGLTCLQHGKKMVAVQCIAGRASLVHSATYTGLIALPGFRLHSIIYILRSASWPLKIVLSAVGMITSVRLLLFVHSILQYRPTPARPHMNDPR